MDRRHLLKNVRSDLCDYWYDPVGNATCHSMCNTYVSTAIEATLKSSTMDQKVGKQNCELLYTPRPDPCHHDCAWLSNQTCYVECCEAGDLQLEAEILWDSLIYNDTCMLDANLTFRDVHEQNTTSECRDRRSEYAALLRMRYEQRKCYDDSCHTSYGFGNRMGIAALQPRCMNISVDCEDIGPLGFYPISCASTCYQRFNEANDTNFTGNAPCRNMCCTLALIQRIRDELLTATLTECPHMGEIGVLYTENFEDIPHGPINETAARTLFFSEWAVGYADNESDSRANVVNVSCNGTEWTNALQIGMNWGEVGTKDSGASTEIKLPGSFGSMWLSYRIMFSAGFIFGRGGKLLGFNGGWTGCNRGLGGWSARSMFGDDKDDADCGVGPMSLICLEAYRSNNTRGCIKQYVYSGHTVGTCGDYLVEDDENRCDLRVAGGIWYCAEQYVKMNTPGVEDGHLQLWWNGNLILNRTNMLYRLSAVEFIQALPNNLVYFSFQGINHLYIGSFRGGQNPTWSVNASQAIFYDDVTVSEHRAPYCSNYLGPCEITVPKYGVPDGPQNVQGTR